MKFGRTHGAAFSAGAILHAAVPKDAGCGWRAACDRTLGLDYRTVKNQPGDTTFICHRRACRAHVRYPEAMS